MDLALTLIGTAASAPTAGRGVAATLIARGGERILIDCGEGTQRQLMRSGLGLVDLDLILITHLHGDHILGLPGLLKTYALRARERGLRIVGPTGLERLFDTLRPLVGRLPYRLELDERAPTRPGTAWEAEGARIEPFATRHSAPSMGFALVEEDRPGMFDVDAARALGVTPGPDFGVLQRGGAVVAADGTTVRPDQVMGEPRLGRRVVVTGDTEPCGETLDAAEAASVLVHESTFLDADRERARETRHSTAREAAVLGREADVDLLVLTHLSARFPAREARDEARAVFDRAVVGRDFDRIEVPFPERGVPVHLPRGDRRGTPGAAEERGTVS
ncbi:MAG: ribonuclease Z [Miltoncostaeaceae bacterium]